VRVDWRGSLADVRASIARSSAARSASRGESVDVGNNLWVGDDDAEFVVMEAAHSLRQPARDPLGESRSLSRSCIHRFNPALPDCFEARSRARASNAAGRSDRLAHPVAVEVSANRYSTSVALLGEATPHFCVDEFGCEIPHVTQYEGFCAGRFGDTPNLLDLDM
jgi:hypothetical protein